MKHWERIKHIRTDMSEYVLHCTRSQISINGEVAKSAFDVLKSILKDGYFKATFAERNSKSGKRKNTIQGNYAAVCFTEQPLKFFVESIQANQRYTKYAIAVRKDELFLYGGRPVIYSDDITLFRLPDELKYLWVHYNPTALWQNSRGGYPIDWTHEREWRVKVSSDINLQIGLSKENVVPIHLPTVEHTLPMSPRFVILVATEKEKETLSTWIYSNFMRWYRRDNGMENNTYWKNYAMALFGAREQILSFEHVLKSKNSFGRIEDYIRIVMNN